MAKQNEAIQTGWYAIKIWAPGISGYIIENHGGHLIVVQNDRQVTYRVEINKDKRVSIFSSKRYKYLHLDAGAFLFNAPCSKAPEACFELYEVERHEGHDVELEGGRGSVYIPTRISAKLKSLSNALFLRVHESKNRKGQAIFSTVFNKWDASKFQFEVPS